MPTNVFENEDPSSRHSRGAPRATDIGMARTKRGPRRCPCGNCTEIGLCAEHRERLALVKAEIANDMERLGTFARRSDQRCVPDWVYPDLEETE